MPATGPAAAHARVMACLTFLSRVLGLIREQLFSYYFGTGGLLSAFRIAFMVPNLARRLFGEGALSAAMIPVLTKSLQDRGDAASRKLVGSLVVQLVLVLLLLVAVVEAGIALGRTRYDNVVLTLTAILMPYTVFICVVAVGGGVLNVRGRFALPAAVPIILNTLLIVAMLGGAILLNLEGQALMVLMCGAVLAAGIIQVATVAVALRRASFWPDFGLFGRRHAAKAKEDGPDAASAGWRDPAVHKVRSLMAPMVVGLSAVQINALADYIIAYLFVVEEGVRSGPAILGYAQFLYQLPLGVFGIAIATAIFPVLSKKAAKGDRAGLADVLSRGVRLSLFIALPASVGLMFVAKPLVATLYQRGAFDEASTERVAGTLLFYSAGLAAYFVQHLLVRAFYAMHDSRMPARVAMSMVGVNLCMNLVLVQWLQERGLALATAVCAGIQVVWLFVKLRHKLPEVDWTPIVTGTIRMVTATAVMAVVLGVLTIYRPAEGVVGDSPAMNLMTLVIAGVASYALAARLLRIEELRITLSRGRALQGP